MSNKLLHRSRQLTALLLVLLLAGSVRAGITVVGADGITVVGADGITVVGADGISAVGADGVMLNGADGITVVGADGMRSSADSIIFHRPTAISLTHSPAARLVSPAGVNKSTVDTINAVDC